MLLYITMFLQSNKSLHWRKAHIFFMSSIKCNLNLIRLGTWRQAFDSRNIRLKEIFLENIYKKEAFNLQYTFCWLEFTHCASSWCLLHCLAYRPLSHTDTHAHAHTLPNHYFLSNIFHQLGLWSCVFLSVSVIFDRNKDGKTDFLVHYSILTGDFSWILFGAVQNPWVLSKGAFLTICWCPEELESFMALMIFSFYLFWFLCSWDYLILLFTFVPCFLSLIKFILL